MIGVTLYRRPIHLQRLFDAGPVTIGQNEHSECHFQYQGTDFASEQMQIDWSPDSSGKVIVRNLGNTILLENGVRMYSGAEREFELPVTIWVGETVVRMFDPQASHDNDRYLRSLTIQHSDPAGGLVLPHESDASPSASTLVAWFNCFSQLQSTTAGSHEFFQLAARAVFDPGGLDACLVLSRDRHSEQWKIEASYIPHPEQEICYRPELLQRVVDSGQLVFHDATGQSRSASTAGPASIVVAPVKDIAGEVSGVIYGIRCQHRKNSRQGIRPLEAHFCNLVAQSAAAAQIRLDKETEIARSQVLLEQAFPPSVVQQLRRDPEILEGQQKPVSVIFCDIREFSEIANRLAPKATYQMVSDIMDRWTNIVLGHGGTIVDYYGDGLSAFWNAPLPIDGYTEVAVACAMDIRESMPELNEFWMHLVGRPLRLGIGISSGMAQVGNCGSRVRIKYGPHGSVVNLASRIEEATKSLGVPVLACPATAERIHNKFIVRRVVKAQLKGFEVPIDLFEPIPAIAGVNHFKLAEDYERALAAAEGHQWEAAGRALAEMQSEFLGDPAIRLLNQIIQNRLSLPLDLHSLEIPSTYGAMGSADQDHASIASSYPTIVEDAET